MSFTDPISRARAHLAAITGGGWEAHNFSVRAMTGGLIGNMQRTTDAQFIAEAPTIIAALLKMVADAQGELKKARYAVSADRDELTTLKDRLAGAEARRDELQRQLDAAYAELDQRGAKRR